MDPGLLFGALRDGGHAFPSAPDNQGRTHANGISKRDYFAAAALTGICGDGIPGSHHRPEQTAKEAYAYADAMLKARES